MNYAIFLTLKVWVFEYVDMIGMHGNMCHICEIALYGIIDMYACETKNMKSLIYLLFENFEMKWICMSHIVNGKKVIGLKS